MGIISGLNPLAIYDQMILGLQEVNKKYSFNQSVSVFNNIFSMLYYKYHCVSAMTVSRWEQICQNDHFTFGFMFTHLSVAFIQTILQLGQSN